MNTRRAQSRKTATKRKQIRGFHKQAMLDTWRRNNGLYSRRAFHEERRSKISSDNTPRKTWIHWFFILLFVSSGLIAFRNLVRNTNRVMNDASQSEKKISFNADESLQANDELPAILADIKEQMSLNTTNDICQMLVAGSLCQGNLGISRDQMPQLNDKILADFVKQAQLRGMTVNSLTLPAKILIMTQAQLHANTTYQKYLQAKSNGANNPCNREILVATDSLTGAIRIIDGHHTAIGCRLAGGDQKVTSITQDAKEMLDELKGHHGVETSSLLFFVNDAKALYKKRDEKLESVIANKKI